MEGVADTKLESGPCPTEFIATTLKTYDTSFVRPVICAPFASPVTVFVFNFSVPSSQ